MVLCPLNDLRHSTAKLSLFGNSNFPARIANVIRSCQFNSLTDLGISCVDARAQDNWDHRTIWQRPSWRCRYGLRRCCGDQQNVSDEKSKNRRTLQGSHLPTRPFIVTHCFEPVPKKSPSTRFVVSSSRLSLMSTVSPRTSITTTPSSVSQACRPRNVRQESTGGASSATLPSVPSACRFWYLCANDFAYTAANSAAVDALDQRET